MVRLLPLLVLGGCTTILGIDGDYQLGATGGTAGSGPIDCPDDMVAHERFCIDRTEVTEEAYQAFVASGDVPSLAQVRCEGDVTFHPGSSLSADGSRPVTSVDICDAHAYCTWAGKELCGRPGGGQAGSPTEPGASAWFAACAGDEARTFPYGDTHQDAACVDASFGAPGPIPAGEADGCATPLGVLDLAGNVAEWEYSCAHAINCLIRGGSYANDATIARCAGAVEMKWDDISDDVGFRCCIPLP